ncbi:MAG: hypothetical protein IJ315_09435 [Firmicutes bacterium]|nr:hypothetical protein [Bacillota bacterium]
MEQVMMEWLGDLAQEAVQYGRAYAQVLEEEQEPLKRRLLERSMLDKQAQLRCLQQLGAVVTEMDADSSEPISMKLLLYNEIENQAVYRSLELCLGVNPHIQQICAKQQQIVQRLTAYLI